MTIDKLNQIEREAVTAPATMLRLYLTEVRACLASASSDARDYACVLLLKLEHRLREESVGESCVSESPAYLAPRIGIFEPEKEAA